MKSLLNAAVAHAAFIATGRAGGTPLANLSRSRREKLKLPSPYTRDLRKAREEHEMPGYKGPRVLDDFTEHFLRRGVTSRKERGARGFYKPHQGARERARRMGQMAAQRSTRNAATKLLGRIRALMRFAESGDTWAQICALEAEYVRLTGEQVPSQS